MKHEYQITYESDLAVRSRYKVAREVKKAIQKNESAGTVAYDNLERRKILRHELAHHLPSEKCEVRVMSGLRLNNEGTVLSDWVSISHYNPGKLESILSAIAPLMDRRFKQKLSKLDLSAIVTTIFG